MKCFNCKYEFEEDLGTCPACGSTDIAAEKEDYIAKGTCPNCHAKLSDKDICPSCGIDVENYTEEPKGIPLETQQKIAKVGEAVGLTIFLVNMLPIIILFLLLGFFVISIILLGKGIVTIMQLVRIIKITMIVVPIILTLLFFKFKGENTKPILRKVLLVIALLFVGINILYHVQPFVRFSNYGSQEVITLDDYSIPTIAKVYKGKVITSVKIKENQGTAYILEYAGTLSKDKLNEYIALLESEKFSKKPIDNLQYLVYVKYDGRNSLLVKIDIDNPNQKCKDTKCVDQNNTWSIEYWFIKGDYHKALESMNEPIKQPDDELQEVNIED